MVVAIGGGGVHQSCQWWRVSVAWPSRASRHRHGVMDSHGVGALSCAKAASMTCLARDMRRAKHLMVIDPEMSAWGTRRGSSIPDECSRFCHRVTRWCPRYLHGGTLFLFLGHKVLKTCFFTYCLVCRCRVVALDFVMYALEKSLLNKI
jgi:hypothetical protein